MTAPTEAVYIETQIAQLRDAADVADREATGCQRNIERIAQARDSAKARAAACRAMADALAALLPKPADEPAQEAA